MPHTYLVRSLKDRRLVQVKPFVWHSLQRAVAHFGHKIDLMPWDSELADFLRVYANKLRELPSLADDDPVVPASLEPPAASRTPIRASSSPRSLASSSSAEEGSSGSNDSELSGSLAADSDNEELDSVDLALLEWGTPLGSAARLHRLKDGKLPGCARGSALPEDNTGFSFSLAYKLFPERLWCKTCSRDLFQLAASRLSKPKGGGD